MDLYADNNYIYAKIWALHSLLLKRGDYNGIVKSGSFRSLPGLPQTEYDIRRESTLIRESIFKSQVKHVILLAGSSAKGSALFTLFLRHFEILNLKLLCARAFGREPSPFIWYETGPAAPLNRGMLDKITDIDSLLRLTSRTWMRDVFTAGPPLSFEEAEYLIERRALASAAGLAGSMRFADRADYIKMISGLTALFRLSWRWRLDRVYAVKDDEIKKYIESRMLIPGHGRRIAAEAEIWEARLIKDLRSEQGGGIPDREEGLVRAERAMERCLMRWFSRTFRENFHSVNTAGCYLFLLYRQIWNLFSIAEGLRSGLPADTIMENIICGGE